MMKKIIIFVALFIAASVIMLVFSDNVDVEKRYETNLCQSVKVNQNEKLIINLINTTDEKAQNHRCEIIESSELKDSVEIYRYKFYDDRSTDYEITVDGNDISIKDYLGNISIYRCLAFISNTQYKEYKCNLPKRVYKIYIPQGMKHSFQ